ncbi:nuclear transport factor 2 family protein [Sphingobium sp. H33]|uniref:Nuclear transport factor 2 family protein n=2 Tax=Sphingobium nicotianae TaxID=2782607 RepID=A0A9X1ISI3_9SPHN|nr:nuclear transport factor 2 family protein [Sphingobium nicotianae]
MFAAWALTASSLGLGASAAAQPPADSTDALARDVTRLESLRQVKDLQRSYAQYAQFGLWPDMAALFAKSGRIVWGDQVIEGPAAIAKWLAAHGGPAGTTPGALNNDMIDDPLINLSLDGESARGRWRGLAFRGDGKGKAWMEGGLYENDYVREGGRWKIATLHYYPQYEGSYATGWSNVGQQELPIVPFHFTHDEVGVPIPPAAGAAPPSGTTLAALQGRIAAVNDEDDVRNLQNSYGYYVDMRMWDDVVDLFADDGVIEMGGKLYKGKAGVRQAMALMGPAGLTRGILNDHPLFDTIVRVSPGGTEAYARGTDLGMIGDAEKGTARWDISVFRNRFVKQGGLWKIREMRLTPLMTADYKTGWANGGTRPAMPALLGANPATGKPVATKGLTIAAAKPLTAAIAAASPAAAPTLADLRRRYMRSVAFDGTENVSAAYGYYLDDFQWPGMSGIFAVKGNKQSPFAGYYFGRDRIAGAAAAMYGATPDASTVKRQGIAFHWRIQPVIHVSHDGRSTLQRTRLFHPNTGKYDAAAGGPNKRNTIQTGMYPNDQFVLEDGIWRMWTLTIDEPYMMMPDWQGGWSAAKPPAPGGGMRPSPLLQRYPPDLLISALGKREEGFAGGPGTTINWPDILPMWFHYRNPVSGRQPPLYWPDCVPCEAQPQNRMTNNGYQMPPNGPAVDGVELK